MAVTEDIPSTHIQINFYRMIYGRFEYLILKRIDQQKDFWQGVTQAVSNPNDIASAVKQAAAEQIGVSSFVRLSEEMYTYEWYTHGQRGRDIVFAAELSPQTVITINKSRYNDYQWLPFEPAIQHLKWLGAKDALRDLHTFLEAKKLSNPEYWPDQDSGIFSTDHKFDVGQMAMEHSNAYGDRVTKRLPDRPEDSHESNGSGENTDVNTGEWFL